MTMRKKDYEAIAHKIQTTDFTPGDRSFANGFNAALDQVSHGIADYCASQDPTFKRDRFLADCGVSHG